MQSLGMGSGMTMMGQPTVVGSGNDANNYLDVRNEVHYTDQGTIRLDHQFGTSDTAFARYSAGGEHGFMPENLPGFGYLHDNLSQQGMGSYSHIFTPSLLNVATVAVSRLSMNHTTESAYKNDITGQLGIQGVGFGGPGAWGAPYFNVQGYSPIGDSYAATPMHAWDTLIEGRDTVELACGTAQPEVRRTVSVVYLAHVGPLSESRLLRQARVPQMNLRQWYAAGYGKIHSG
jgi:hypothetical protein